MTNISKRNELEILKYWLDDFYNNCVKIPESLKGEITSEQTTNLFAHFQDLGDNDEGRVKKEITNRVRELETKFQKDNEQTWKYTLLKKLKEKSAEIVVSILLLVIVWFIFKVLF